MSIQDGCLIKGQKNAHHHTPIQSTVHSVDATSDQTIFSLVTTFKAEEDRQADMRRRVRGRQAVRHVKAEEDGHAGM